jgi:hypothetical protein
MFKPKLFSILTLVILIVLIGSANIAQGDEPPTIPTAGDTIIQSDRTVHKYSYEQQETVHAQNGSGARRSRVNVIEEKRKFVPALILSDAQMAVLHRFSYVDKGSYYDTWTYGETTTNYTSNSIYIQLRHKWGSSCQNTAWADDDTDYNTDKITMGLPHAISYSGTQHCVWGSHSAQRSSNPSYNFFLQDTFPTVTLP